MTSVMGWKDILRPIRDGYRHLFPSPDTGPTPEEREKQRKVDSVKGFTYFDTFDQLDAWTEALADPLQRANTPLLQRSQVPDKDKSRKADILLCHDYSGNYRPYEAASGIGLDEESYSCEQLQFVDSFIYFSHKLVCVPPPAWTNHLHRNGVKCIGTLLVEPQTKESDRLLERVFAPNVEEGNPTFTLATKLASIAKHYGFDGWLINIEKPFSKDSWDPNVLQAFLAQLKEEIGPDKSLIWYDAITINNKVDYQNSLTLQNILFAKSCSQVLTNYCWKEANARESKELSQRYDLLPTDIFFGVDVWAQNTTKLTHPRITYGGGGTNTGVAVTELADMGLSVGVFAPAWSFEHFPGSGRNVDEAMWSGLPLPVDLKCSCGDAQSQHPSNPECPILRSATHFPAGSETFFYTNFTRGFGLHSNREGAELYEGKKLHSQLASQSVLPNMPTTSVRNDQDASTIHVLAYRLEDLVSQTQLVAETESFTPQAAKEDTIYERWLPLFKLEMRTSANLQIRMLARKVLEASNSSVSIYLKFADGRVTTIGLPETGGTTLTRDIGTPGGEEPQDNSRLQEFGIHLRAPHLGQKSFRVAVIQELCIAPHRTPSYHEHWSIDNIHVGHRGDGDTSHWRLCWAYQSTGEVEDTRGLPYSETTGPFSHFCVSVDGMMVGRAYALEFVLHEYLVGILEGEGREFEIRGVGFDGRTIAEGRVQVRL
ncbi:glycoside hydrolase family 85 protein [Lophiostoma macrostomum CBS 122681]|uniref:Glycoside hydrolase family 85 protein n=1 Tax=Lophiostoma macrostomum CBS 122681 TaxID=1314788 RepID=A0A6A6TMN5_9PLEO|nr:glycoside hydrolase family 85 protein [Lophiostoma macrostomum CBS 122681]